MNNYRLSGRTHSGTECNNIYAIIGALVAPRDGGEGSGPTDCDFATHSNDRIHSHCIICKENLIISWLQATAEAKGPSIFSLWLGGRFYKANWMQRFFFLPNECSQGTVPKFLFYLGVWRKFYLCRGRHRWLGNFSESRRSYIHDGGFKCSSWCFWAHRELVTSHAMVENWCHYWWL